ncbi:MAG: ribonuclease P protein component [Merismopedia sp. SIO2A8]|nr:ribonuclease P protein component [Merismopedia sp. SIO2A8]
MALPKEHRLQHRRDFNRVYRSGLRRNSHHLSLRALSVVNQRSRPSHLPVSRLHNPSSKGAFSKEPFRKDPLFAEHTDIPPTRIGISISNKVSKRAVIRNRIKRQIKAALFQLLPTVAPGWLMVVTVHPQAIECDYWQFLRELEEMMQSLR